MALPSIIFKKGQGGLGRPLPGQDFVSAFVFYTANLPSGFTSSARIKTFYALSDAESAGIKSDASDATPAAFTYLITAGAAVGTAATATITITGIGTDGDTIDEKVSGASITGGAVAKTSSETTATLLATKIKNAINAATSTNGGYSATNTGAVITITGPVSLGATINTITPSGTIAGTITQTNTAFTGGVNATTGDTINIKVTEPGATIVDLGTYTKVSGDSTIALLGASIAAMINGGTLVHGYTAAFNTATLTVTTPKKLGIYLNTATTPVAVAVTGTIAGTLTQPSGGTASELSIWHYHISEFFRMQPKGVLYVGFFAVPGSYDFTEITTIQDFSIGTIRQVAIYKGFASAFATGDLTLIDTVVKANDDRHKPLSAIYAADLSGTADISTLTDLGLLTANKVSAVIGQDGGGQGDYLWQTTGKSITAIGTLLGTVSLAKVSESVAWVAQFNLSNGSECEKLAFANGQLFSSAAITDNLLEALNTKRYLFLKKFSGLSGSWWNDSHTAIIQSSDYAYIENNRTIDKAIRGIYISLLPSLNGPLTLNADGSLAETTTAYLESQAEVNLNQMVRDTELSAFAVTIDPTQNVLSTSKIIIAVTLVINGVARTIEIPIGFKPSIA